MNQQEREIIRMREVLDGIKTERDRKQGQYDQLLQQLKEKFGIDSVEDAEEKLKELKKKEDELLKKFETVMEKLNKEYDWT